MNPFVMEVMDDAMSDVSRQKTEVELMQIAADFFESEGIHYRVVGSMASMAFGEPRFTNDVDIVAQTTKCRKYPKRQLRLRWQ